MTAVLSPQSPRDVSPPRTVVVVEHEQDCTIDLFGPWLADAGCELAVRRPWRGEPVGGLAGAGGLVVLGGSMGAYDDDRAPWLPAVRDLLRDAVAARVPTLGICLGAQLLAVATGGRVERGATGTEAGIVDVSWHRDAADDPLVGGLPDPFAAPSMHDDAVVLLPPGAVLLGSSPRYPNQAFRAGACAWGVQFHPELSPCMYEAWANADARPDVDWVVPSVHAQADRTAATGELLARRYAAVVAADAASATTPG